MSTVDPDGTWQYAHSVCWPAGARVGRPPRAGRPARTVRPGAARPRRRPRSPRSPRTCRRDAACPPAGPRRSPTGRARTARNQPCTPRLRNGTAAARGRTGWQLVPGHGQQRPRRDIEQDGPHRRQLGEGTHPPAGLDGPAGRDHRTGHRVGDPRAAALGHRPAEAMGQRDQHHPHRAGRRRGQRHHPVRGRASEQGTALWGAEPPGHTSRGPESVAAENGNAR